MIALNITQQRLSQGLSHSDLAKKAGIGRTTLHRIERGVPVQESSLRAVAAALNVNFHEMTSSVRAVKGRKAFIAYGEEDKVWFAHEDTRAKIPEDNQTLIQDPAERLRQGRNGLVKLFACNPSFGMPHGPGMIYIELYGAYREGVNPDVFRHAVLLCQRGAVRVVIDGETIFLKEGSSVAYENHLPMSMEPAEPVGPDGFPPLLLWLGGFRVGKV